MKMFNKRFISVCILLALLCGTISSCGKTEIETTDAEEVDTTPAVTETEKRYLDDMPETMDFNGATVNLTYSGFSFYKEWDAIGDTELTGDVVKDAVYTRNSTIEERLNVDLNWVEGEAHWQNYPSTIENLIMAGDYVYDLCVMQPSKANPIAVQGGCRDMTDLPYTDYDKDYWHTELMKDYNYYNRFYLVCGANMITTLMSASCTIFNKDLYTDAFGDVNDLYDMVEDQKWTIDKMRELSENVYEDTNGNGTVDLEDTIGFEPLGWGISNIANSCGLKFTLTGDDGKEVINVYNEQTISLVDKLYKLLNDSNITYKKDGYVTEDVNNIKSIFSAGKMLFYVHSLESMTAFREMEDAYGCLPIPLYEEGYEYSGYTGGSCMIMPAPVPDENLEVCGAVLEAMAAESHKFVVPAWYEITLKQKVSDTQRDADMIEIIYDNLSANKFSIMNSVFFYEMVQTNGMDGGGFSSYYAAKKSSMETQWEGTYDQYAALAN